MRRFFRILGLVLALLVAVSGCALADGSAPWVRSRLNGDVQLASFAGDYDGWVDISGLGGIAMGERISVRVISKSASVWAEPRTNSKKLGSVSNGDELSGVPSGAFDANIEPIVEQDGFYAVEYKGKRGWINSAYVVHGPFEIVLMESNVPAYCAPDRGSKRVGSLSKLTRYTVLGFCDDFYVVNLRGGSAFISMSVAHYDTHFERWYHAGWHGRLTVTASTALRTGPGERYAKVSDLRAGQTFDCMDEIDGWCLVANGSEGGYTYIWSGDAQVDW